MGRDGEMREADSGAMGLVSAGRWGEGEGEADHGDGGTGREMVLGRIRGGDSR